MVVGQEDRLLIECRQDASVLLDLATNCPSIDGADEVASAAESLIGMPPEDFPVPLSFVVDLDLVPDPDAVARSILDYSIRFHGDEARELSRLLLLQVNPYLDRDTTESH
ncbi:MAG TPA: hypothetical protein PKB09_00835 [Candidatus Saccharibacteria bacterium]|nr:hypothetical protein [Candidatus Saccharibacteria bacterium]